MSERTYSDEEVAAIFALAAEHQRQVKRRSSATGLTLAEIQEAGREAGFDPETVRAAAQELTGVKPFSKHSKVAVAERWIETPLEKGAWPDLVATLRGRYGPTSAWLTPETATVGAALEWRHTSASSVMTTVTLSPREDGTLLRVVKEGSGMDDERLMGWLLAFVIGLAPAVVAGALIAETFAMGDYVGIVTVLCVLLASVAGGGPLLAGRIRKGRRDRVEEVQTIADELAQQLDAGRSSPTPESSGEAVSPSIELANGAATVESAVRNERRRQRG